MSVLRTACGSAVSNTIKPHPFLLQASNSLFLKEPIIYEGLQRAYLSTDNGTQNDEKNVGKAARSAGRGSGSFHNYIKQHQTDINRFARQQKVDKNQLAKKRDPRTAYKSSNFGDAEAPGRSKVSSRSRKSRSTDLDNADDDEDTIGGLKGRQLKEEQIPLDLEEFTEQEVKRGYVDNPDDPNGAKEYFELMKYCHENPEISISINAKIGKGGLNYKRARTMHELVAELQMPTDLAVKPEDEEYDELCNFWTAIARNPSYTGYQKRLMIVRLATYIRSSQNQIYFTNVITPTPEELRGEKPEQNESEFFSDYEDDEDDEE